MNVSLQLQQCIRTLRMSTRRVREWTYRQLLAEVRSIAAALRTAKQGPGSRVAIIMPMTPFAVALYLATVYIGAAVVSVAESFSAAEMRTRLDVGGATLIIVQVRSTVESANQTCTRVLLLPYLSLQWEVRLGEVLAVDAHLPMHVKCRVLCAQDEIVRANKRVPLYTKIQSIPLRAIPTIVVAASASFASATNASGSQLSQASLAQGDEHWAALAERACNARMELQEPHIGSCDDVINVLFSSGTTGTPKAIPWTHITPLRCVRFP